MAKVIRAKVIRLGAVLGGALIAAYVAVHVAGAAAPAKKGPAPWSPVEVSTQEIDTGYAFTNDQGRPVYTNDLDKGTKISCNDACLGVQWIPIFARETSKPQGDWSVMLRDDKATQWAYKKKPVYNYYGADPLEDVVAADKHWHRLEP